jgi:phosphoglycerate dehydrogenase-like enzyme
MPELNIICDLAFPEDALKILRDGVAPHRLIVSPPAKDKTGPAASLEEADIALGQPSVESVLDSKRLRWIQVTSAGYTRYDTPEFRQAAAARGLAVTNSSTVFAEPCAEHLLAFMLAQTRQIPAALREDPFSDNAAWKWPNSLTCLRGQDVLLAGHGAIARRLIQLLAPFEMKVTAMSRRPDPTGGVPVITPANITAALAQADHVVNILPDNADSRGFFSAARFSEMKSGACFYNIGRGATVNQAALAASLRESRLRAAWLDVTDPEPLPRDHELRKLPNCHITPHIGGHHEGAYAALVRHFLSNLHLFLQEQPLADRVI